MKNNNLILEYVINVNNITQIMSGARHVILKQSIKDGQIEMNMLIIVLKNLLKNFSAKLHHMMR